MLDIQLKWIRLDQLDPLRIPLPLVMLEPHSVPLVTIHCWIEVAHGVTVGIAWAPASPGMPHAPAAPTAALPRQVRANMAAQPENSAGDDQFLCIFFVRNS